ncbi:MAG: KEOPS complex N(6)-L-threonylcarbamoyladenine synthase Kae1 [Nanoarchaeota archaeon]|nr:tRNA (adenosine(37)-N6)-threonylcarbamoyltransferase complex transferase subunit TsaD [Nanoarchaeota archaeon]MBU4451400.1 tRNA (adenosine(37)-N6)-threonylcarbamoyltransferase complex transferase subunit TsaD [Nanoarchaeota archaeon]MCG2724194.1 tRNA (adenosine(37)-N6)-threonylcarbamoyltransferase complex transferase subunit TsaD [archaeon]
MISLGIESTAHTFGIGIVDDNPVASPRSLSALQPSVVNGKVYSNARDTYRPEAGGIHPSKARDHHKAVAEAILQKALDDAKLKLSDIDIIAYSAGPGISPCLAVGLDFAKKLSEKIKKPLVPVNHCLAHVEIGKLMTGACDPLVLYVSGGNSQIIGWGGGKYRVFGETLDIAIGNAVDKFARETGIPFPGGPEVEKLAVGGKYIPLPYTVKGMDFSFSGLCTDVVRKFKSGKFDLKDICFSFQETAYAMLTEVTERALAHTEKNTLLLTGGVAANKRLAEMLSIMCKERRAEFRNVPREFAGDCGANIAWTGIIEFKKKSKTKIDIFPKWRIDEL